MDQVDFLSASNQTCRVELGVESAINQIKLTFQ